MGFSGRPSGSGTGIQLIPAISGPRGGPFERPQQTVSSRSPPLGECELSTRRSFDSGSQIGAIAATPAHDRGMNRRDGEPPIGRSEINDQSTHTPGTATLRNRCGEATALDG